MSKLELILLRQEYAIHKLEPGAALPDGLDTAEFSCVCRAAEGATVVCPANIPLIAVETKSGWSVLKVLGPLDFALTGILAGISSTLANAGASIFALSTWETDFILVRKRQLAAATEALEAAGYQIDSTLEH
jgi:hypothetical protein